MKTECALIFGLVAVVLASEPPPAKETNYAAKAPYNVGVRYGYHGYYPGKCGNDGFYLNDAASFVICSNGNAYVQPCAPGTRNNPKKFSYGSYYTQGDFCNENLNDRGYGAKYSGYYYGGYPYGYPYGGYPAYPGAYPYYW